MIIYCGRCKTGIESASHLNADYIITPDEQTMIVCPDCYDEDDFIIWGIHKYPIPITLTHTKPSLIKRIRGWLKLW